jgi:hypothetical protein
MSRAMGECVGLAGAGTGDDEKRRRVAMLDGMALFRIEPGEVRRCCHADRGESSTPTASTPFDLSANRSFGADGVCPSVIRPPALQVSDGVLGRVALISLGMELSRQLVAAFALNLKCKAIVADALGRK